MNSSDEAKPSQKSDNNQDILKSLRHLNSCITLTSVKDGNNSGSRSPSSSSDSGASSEEEDTNIPSALRGISIQGVSGKGNLLSDLLAKSKEKKTSVPVTTSSSSLSALRGISIQSVSTKGGESLKEILEKANKDSNDKDTVKAHSSGISTLPTLRGVSIQGVSAKGDSNRNKGDDDSDHSQSSSEEGNPPASKNFPSFHGISIQGVTATQLPSKDSEDENSSHSSSAPSSPGVPSALKGITIQGSSKESLISNILRKPEGSDKENKVESQSKWLNEWSKRCLSISFSTQGKGDEGDDEKQAVEEKGELKNGTAASHSAASSASNSRDSCSQSREQTSSPKSAIPKTSSASKASATPSSEEKSIKPQQEANEKGVGDQKNSTQPKNQVEKFPANSPQCRICNQVFANKNEILNHIPHCPKLVRKPSTDEPAKKSHAVARKKTAAHRSPISHPIYHSPSSSPTPPPSPQPGRSRQRRSCIHCGIFNFRSYLAFEEHHAAHIRNSEVRVYLKHLSFEDIESFCPESGSEDSENSRGSSGGLNTGSEPYKGSSDERGLKLTFKISQQRGRGRKRKTVEIVNNNQEMNEGSPSANEGEEMGTLADTGQQLDSRARGVEGGEAVTSNSQAGRSISQTSVDFTSDGESSSSSHTNFSGFDSNLGFNTTPVNDRPPSTYQPQFESFPGDWFNEYESGSRIAAAMTGSSSADRDQNSSNAYATSAEGSTSSTSYDVNMPSVNKDIPQSSSGDGLFSQAVLGGEGPHTSDDQRQGSFEQLCLNDSFGHNQQDGGLPGSSIDPNYDQSQQYHNQQVQGSGDLLSELEYLNNSGQQSVDPIRTSPHEGSNSGTPTSSVGHPTPPPTDTSFRALATSPLNSPTSPMNSGGPTPPMHSGSTPPIPGNSSPLQQMGQMGQMQQSQETTTAPRLTIANNLMPSTTDSSMAGVDAYGQQWPSSSSSQQSFNSSYMSTPSMSGAMPGVRPSSYANMPTGYRPSPPPRIRGRPPLMGHVGRPSMIRGPGRPPGTSGLPPLMPTGGRGGMMPSIRPSQYGNSRGAMMGGQKRTQPQASQSPNKTMRREDINVPARQKDNECQIIAVANRTDGMPVISSVQGRDERSKSASSSSTESTIHLSDSITLSVRSNQNSGKDPARGEKGGDAGVVANLLASRGITVTPAAGEKESSGREERRLPTASDLNLSSAISVHPPTSRDRDGFAVPHPPSPVRSSATVPSQVDRPPRPPTVDLTQDVSPIGAASTRYQCHQCERSFPTQALLSDHSKIHQQQSQSRMPFKCHLCSAGFSSQKGQQHHYQQFHQIHLSAGDLAIPVVDFRNPVNVQRMARLGIRSFLPLSNLQNRGAGGVVGIPILTLENLQNGQVNMQQWGITDVLTLGPAKTLNPPR